MRNLLGPIVLLASACMGEIGGGETRPEGFGSGSGSDSVEEEEVPQPRVTGSFDKTTLTTELAKTETLTLSVTSENGFAGEVTLGAVLADSTGVALGDVELTGPTTLTLAPGATEIALFELEVPMDALGATFAGTLTVDLMSTAATTSVTSDVTIEAVYTVDYTAGTGYDANKHANAGDPDLSVKRGAILRFTNSDVIDHVIYGAGRFTNYHENTVSGGAPGRTYEIPTASIPPGTGTLGCFNHGNETYSIYQVL